MNKLLLRDTDRRVSNRQERAFQQSLASVSIIIPVGPGERSWRTLLGSFGSLAAEAEILLVATEPQPADFAAMLQRCKLCCQVQWATTEVGRAHQMNVGAAHSRGEFLWFLHADCQVTFEALASLDKSLTDFPGVISYFDLAFAEGSPTLTRLNAWGVWMRSHCLWLPFGDQGLCMSRETFELLQGFCEEVPYGEDHLLIWAAHRERIPLRCVGATLKTSARKYEANGWFSTTAQHFWRTWYQAIPQGIASLGSRLR